MTIKINYKTRECPICNNDLKSEGKYYLECPNRCVSYEFDGHTGLASVFLLSEFMFYNIEFFPDSDHEFSETELELIETINYWRENDRYLMRMLTND